jgi:phosphoribosylformylglycinamidine cyclo-ligase
MTSSPAGATPLFFLDYIAMGKLAPERIESIAHRLAQACRSVGCALIGGENAEMPGVYEVGDYDLAGFIISVVEKRNIVSGNSIDLDDIILGLPSSGLHTNGYSLVRRAFGIEQDSSPLQVLYPALERTLGEELLEPHHCYYSELKPVLPLINGLAHITGGGFIGNIPRILPHGLAAHIKKDAWDTPPIFSLIQKLGGIEEAEMYRVFNMGIGMTIVCSPQQVAKLTTALPEAKIIGKVMQAKENEAVILYKGGQHARHC